MTVEIVVDRLSTHTIVRIVSAVTLVVVMVQQPMKVNTILKKLEWTSLNFEGKWPFLGELGKNEG